MMVHMITVGTRERRIAIWRGVSWARMVAGRSASWIKIRNPRPCAWYVLYMQSTRPGQVHHDRSSIRPFNIDRIACGIRPLARRSPNPSTTRQEKNPCWTSPSHVAMIGRRSTWEEERRYALAWSLPECSELPCEIVGPNMESWQRAPAHACKRREGASVGAGASSPSNGTRMT